ncbi:MAG: DUF3795 domain-containing protein [Firmicutes bacterium]|jgi:hypothetical protein|nr:DUF3795 domain-containing protein [Bacillota bacterium]HKM17326.1 DUF3795 domain-containing protein [Limnochordia bacterium]
MEKLELAACGIDCNECDIYKAAFDRKAAESLARWFKRQGWIGKDEGVEAIMQKAPYCNGCWNKTGVHWCSDCHLLKCCEGRQFNHCGECGGFPCDEYKKWVGDYEHHKQAMDYLMSILR